MKFFLVSGLFLSGLLSESRAWAWGAYGHEQVNDGAVRLVSSPQLSPEQKSDPRVQEFLKQKKSFAECVGRNRDFLVRLAITPDYEWKKMFGIWSKLPNPELKRLVASHDSFEHKLHFFEPDAFLSEAVTSESVRHLPVGEYSQDLAGQYREILIKKKTDATIKDVFNNGTAPWRVAQLYDLAVQSFKGKKVRQALFYLGVLGHYVGDASQPLHTTVNFDGQLNEPPLKGIHSAFETRMLDEQSKEYKRSADKIMRACRAQNLPQESCSPDETYTRLKGAVGWSSFQETSAGWYGVSFYANRLYRPDGSAPIQRENLIKEIMNVIVSGSIYVSPIMKAFHEEIEKYETGQSAKLKKYKKNRKVAQENESNPKASADATAEGEDRSSSKSIPAQVIRNVADHSEIDPVTQKRFKISWLANKRMAEGSVLLARIWNSIFEAAGRPDMGPEACEKYTFDLEEAIRTYPKPIYFPGIKDE